MTAPRLPSPTEATILRLLLGRRESYGLDLVHASGGALKRGTAYVLLNRMVDKGLVESRYEDHPTDGYIGIRRRLYRVTRFGKRALRALDVAENILNFRPPG